jgi:hypothetical protein
MGNHEHELNMIIIIWLSDNDPDTFQHLPTFDIQVGSPNSFPEEAVHNDGQPAGGQG